jgi:hypothetical protein
MDSEGSCNNCYLFAVSDTLNEGASSSADLLEEDSNLMPNGIDSSIPNPLGGQGRFCRCSDEREVSQASDFIRK